MGTSSSSIEHALSTAAKMCHESGTKLTPKRTKLLAGLLLSNKAQSAYDLIDIMQQEYGEKLQPTTVYRMLDMLRNENLVHKLHVSNRYVACSHICCNHPHEVPQFLVCDQCHKVVEISVNQTMIEHFSQQAAANEFVLMSPQLELHCVCIECQENSTKAC